MNSQNNHDDEPEIMPADEIQRMDLATLGVEPKSDGSGDFHRFLELCLAGTGEWSLWTLDEDEERVQIGENMDDEGLARHSFDQYIEEYHANRRPNIAPKGEK